MIINLVVAFATLYYTLLSQFSLVRPQMSRLISRRAVKWQYLQCEEPSALRNKSKSLVAPEVASQFTLAIVFKIHSVGNFPSTFLTCATLTRGDLRRDTKRRAGAEDGEKEATANWDKEQHMGVGGGLPGAVLSIISVVPDVGITRPPTLRKPPAARRQLE